MSSSRSFHFSIGLGIDSKKFAEPEGEFGSSTISLRASFTSLSNGWKELENKLIVVLNPFREKKVNLISIQRIADRRSHEIFPTSHPRYQVKIGVKKIRMVVVKIDQSLMELVANPEPGNLVITFGWLSGNHSTVENQLESQLRRG